LGEQIKRFHNLKEKEDADYDYEKRRKELEVHYFIEKHFIFYVIFLYKKEAEEKQKMMDPEYKQRVEELNNQQVHLLMEVFFFKNEV